MLKIDTIRKRLAAYSPPALAVVALPHLFSVSDELQRSLLRIFCTLSAGIPRILLPKDIPTQPIPKKRPSTIQAPRLLPFKIIRGKS